MRVAATSVSVLGLAMAAAPQALAITDDGGTTSLSGNGAVTEYGNTTITGNQSPQLGAVQGSLNKACIGLPAKVNAGSIVGLVPVAVQDIPILSAPQNQQCTENSTQAKGDEPLSHLVNDIPVLTGNGVQNG
ncbi:rodlin [Streptomyces sp. NPDC050504]|uniref:rodlin n=1 Tax=Streptomyces sp. NPDC050504 TaxID=3365618 RepID=UPI00379CA4C4